MKIRKFKVILCYTGSLKLDAGLGYQHKPLSQKSKNDTLVPDQFAWGLLLGEQLVISEVTVSLRL